MLQASMMLCCYQGAYTVEKMDASMRKRGIDMKQLNWHDKCADCDNDLSVIIDSFCCRLIQAMVSPDNRFDDSFSDNCSMFCKIFCNRISMKKYDLFYKIFLNNVAYRDKILLCGVDRLKRFVENTFFNIYGNINNNNNNNNKNNGNNNNNSKNNNDNGDDDQSAFVRVSMQKNWCNLLNNTDRSDSNYHLGYFIASIWDDYEREWIINILLKCELISKNNEACGVVLHVIVDYYQAIIGVNVSNNDNSNNNNSNNNNYKNNNNNNNDGECKFISYTYGAAFSYMPRIYAWNLNLIIKCLENSSKFSKESDDNFNCANRHIISQWREYFQHNRKFNKNLQTFCVSSNLRENINNAIEFYKQCYISQ